MMWHGHAASGLIAAELTEPLIPHPLGQATFGAYAALAVVAALAPDLDHHDGKLTHSLGPVTWLISRVVVWFSKVLFTATRGPRDYAHSNGHRGITHAPVSGPVVAAGAWMLAPAGWHAVVAVGVLAGWLAHQAGDACTNSGIPMFWPVKINGRRWGHHGIPRWLRFETGGPAESLITVALYALCVGVPVAELWLGIKII